MSQPKDKRLAIFKVLRTSNVQVDIVKFCSTPRTAEGLMKLLIQKWSLSSTDLGDYLKELEESGAVQYSEYQNTWKSTSVALKVIKRYFG